LRGYLASKFEVLVITGSHKKRSEAWLRKSELLVEILVPIVGSAAISESPVDLSADDCEATSALVSVEKSLQREFLESTSTV
jgi:hypothetical protein